MFEHHRLKVDRMNQDQTLGGKKLKNDKSDKIYQQLYELVGEISKKYFIQNKKLSKMLEVIKNLENRESNSTKEKWQDLYKLWKSYQKRKTLKLKLLNIFNY